MKTCEHCHKDLAGQTVYTCWRDNERHSWHWECAQKYVGKITVYDDGKMTIDCEMLAGGQRRDE